MPAHGGQRMGGRARQASSRETPDRRLFAAARFIGRVDSGTQIIVFGAAGTAMPASQGRRRAAVWAVAMATPADDGLWAPTRAGAVARHRRPSGPPEASR